MTYGVVSDYEAAPYFDLAGIRRDEMNKEKEFLEKLSLLKEKAMGQGFRISQEEVKVFFGEEALSEEQMLLVYDYLLSQRITVTGYLKSGDISPQEDISGLNEYTSEEEEYLREYQEDLAALRAEKPGEKEELFELAVKGDSDAKSRLTELYLPIVLEIAKQMRCREVFLGDLVQEGNVSLILALELVKAERNPEQSETDWDLRIRKEIRQGIQILIEEQKEMKRCDKKMEQQVNDLDTALHRLADEKNRAVTIEELAEYMQISEEAILDIMKLAGEDLYDKYKEGGKE